MALAAVLAKISGNGGTYCFDVRACEHSGTVQRKIWEVCFLPDTFARIHPGIIPPNTAMMSGFLRGYQYAANTNLKGLDYTGRLKIR